MTVSLDLLDNPDLGAHGRQDQPIATPIDLALEGDRVRAYLCGLASPSGRSRDGSIRLAARGTAEIRQALTRLAKGTTTSVRNMAVHDRFDTSGRTSELNHAAYRRGVVMDRVVNEVTAQPYPLLPLTGIYTRHLVVAPVRLGLIVSDGNRLVFPGPRLESGEGSMWVSTDRDAIGVVMDLFDAVLATGRHVETLTPTTTNQRRLTVLTYLVNGLTDSAIARRLDVSVRLIEKDIHAVKEIAGVDSRMELVWALGFSCDRFGAAVESA